MLNNGLTVNWEKDSSLEENLKMPMIMVNNIPYAAQKNELVELFRQFGQVAFALSGRQRTQVLGAPEHS